jgi:UPF0755 protein
MFIPSTSTRHSRIYKISQLYKIGKYFIIFLILSLVYVFWRSTIFIQGDYLIKSGETINTIISDISTVDRLKFKWYIFLHHIDFTDLKVWYYQFTWLYTIPDLIQIIKNWPQQKYIHLQILEWRSIYDIQEYLLQLWYSNAYDYIEKTTNAKSIAQQQKKFTYLQDFKLTTLEWFLYPDTYFIDPAKDIVDQLIELQLQTYEKKILKKYNFQSLIRSIQSDYNIALTPYQILILSSIIEKEEKNHQNQTTIAGLFYLRLSKDMRIDADISLCYGLQKPYATCTPAVIVSYLQDATNIYNTRVHTGLPPTPISNPSEATISSMMNYNNTNNIFYLHDTDGNIYFSETIAQHELYKQKYID